jgi:hypothetical protein
VNVPPLPPHPVDQLATWQLRDYRTALESALADAPEGFSAGRTLTERRLAEVIKEQTERLSASMRDVYTAVYEKFADR